MSSNLKDRTLFSIIFAPIVLLAIYFGNIYFNILLLIIFIIGLYEIFKLKILLTKIIIFLLFFCFLYSCLSLNYHSNGKHLIFLLLIISWLSDIGGYLFGKLFGGKKIGYISPNKTYTGIIGSILFSQFSQIYIYYFNLFSNEKNLLLDTGGGVLEGTTQFKDHPFFVINPDTLWSKNYLEEAKKLEEIFYKNNKPSLLIVNKKLSLDKSFSGDFNLRNEIIFKDKENQFIFTGLHITCRNFLTTEKSKVFSMNKIWNDLINKNDLYGIESKQKFYHLNTFEMFNKISNLNIID